MSIVDPEGNTIREPEGTQEVGLNRINWDLRYKGPLPPTGETGFGGPPPGPLALAGTYTVKVKVGDREAAKTVRVEEDPRITLSTANRRAHFDVLQELSRLITAMDQGHEKAADLASQVSSLRKTLSGNGEIPEAVTAAVKGLADKIDELGRKLFRNGGVETIRYPQPTPLFSRLTRLYRTIEGYTEAPSSAHREHIDAYSAELRGLLEQLNGVITQDVADLNRILQENAVPRIRRGSGVDLPQIDFGQEACMSPSNLNIKKLIFVPAVITLGITILRLVGELNAWSPMFFGREAGGGGAIVGISWLPFILGPYFG